jgi:hypothetical protein
MILLLSRHTHTSIPELLTMSCDEINFWYNLLVKQTNEEAKNNA